MIVLGVHMRNMDSAELQRSLKADPETRRIEVIALADFALKIDAFNRRQAAEEDNQAGLFASMKLFASPAVGIRLLWFIVLGLLILLLFRLALRA